MYPSIFGCNPELSDAILIILSKPYHHITTSGPPICSKPRSIDPVKLEAAKHEFLEMEKAGIIRHSDSEWSSPLYMLPKPWGKLQPCGDYRRLNSDTKPDN